MKAVHKTVILCSAAVVFASLLGSRHGSVAAGGHEAASLAVELGLTPSALAAAGFGSGEAQALLDRMLSTPDLRSRLAEAKDASSHAAARLAQLADESTVDPSSAELRAAFAAAGSSAEDCAARLASARRDLLAVALDDVPADRMALLDRCILVRGRRLEGALGVLAHTPSDIQEIEECLIIEARAARLDIAPDPRAVERLASLQTDPEITQAEQRITLNQGAIEAIFGQY